MVNKPQIIVKQIYTQKGNLIHHFSSTRGTQKFI